MVNLKQRFSFFLILNIAEFSHIKYDTFFSSKILDHAPHGLMDYLV